MEDELRKLILLVQEFLALKFSIKTSKNQQRQIMLHYFVGVKNMVRQRMSVQKLFFIMENLSWSWQGMLPVAHVRCLSLNVWYTSFRWFIAEQ